MFAFLGHKFGDSTLGTPSGQINWDADLSGLTSSTGDIADLEDSLENAFEAWENVAAVNFNESASNVDVPIGSASFGGQTLAVATISIVEDFDEPNTSFINFDSSNTVWSPEADNDPTTQNFFAVALHEIGHIIGLEHVDDPTQIMNAFLTAEDLGEGDISGAQFLYGTNGNDVPLDLEGQEPVNGSDFDAFDEVDAVPDDGGDDDDDDDDDDDGGGAGGIIALVVLGIAGLIAAVFSGGFGGGGGAAVAALAATGTTDDDELLADSDDEHDDLIADDGHSHEDFLPGVPVEHFFYSEPSDDDHDDEPFLL